MMIFAAESVADLLPAEQPAARHRNAAVEDDAGAGRARFRQKRREVGLIRAEMLVAENRSALRAELLLEDVGEPLAVRLVVVDDEGLGEAEFARERCARCTLPRVERAEAEERVHLGMRDTAMLTTILRAHETHTGAPRGAAEGQQAQQKADRFIDRSLSIRLPAFKTYSAAEGPPPRPGNDAAL